MMLALAQGLCGRDGWAPDRVGAVWWWASMAAVVVLLLVDLLAHRRSRTVEAGEALLWSAVWVGAGVLFGVVVWVGLGRDAGVTYFAGYLLEKTLSLDYVFVFAQVFALFSVPEPVRHRVLFWGVLVALVLRFGLVMAGMRVLEAVSWVAVPFGSVLLVGAVQVWQDWRLPAGGGLPLRWMNYLVPVVPVFLGARLTVQHRGRRAITMSGVVLLVILGVDVVFAVDAVAAVLAITSDGFLVWTANAFAVLGLHSLYFGLAVLVRRFRYLRPALAVLLVFAGVELMLSETLVGRPPVVVNLGVVVVVLVVAVIGSALTSRHGRALGGARETSSRRW